MSEPTPEIDTPTKELIARGVDARREAPAAGVVAQTLATATAPHGRERHA